MPDFNRINQTGIVMKKVAEIRRSLGNVEVAAEIDVLALGMPALIHSKTYAQFDWALVGFRGVDMQRSGWWFRRASDVTKAAG